jgi:hypothetical protein
MKLAVFVALCSFDFVRILRQNIVQYSFGSVTGAATGENRKLLLTFATTIQNGSDRAVRTRGPVGSTASGAYGFH